MSRSGSKDLHVVTAVIEAGTGVALMGLPSAAAVLLLGTPSETPAALTVARVGGAGLLALGVACWVARDDVQSRAARGLVAAMLIYNITTAAILSFVGVRGLHGVALWPAVIVHAGMAIWCVTLLIAKPTPITANSSHNEV